MKLRMYLRGLGLGLIVAALVLSFSVKTENKTMTDAEIRKRAAELGMVDENSTLKNAELNSHEETADNADNVSVPENMSISDTPVAESTETPVAESAETETAVNTESAEVTAAEIIEADSKSAESGKPEVITEEAVNPEDNKEEVKEENKPEVKEEEKQPEIKRSTKQYTLTIAGGYSSDRVADILYRAGVVGSAADFDKFLCSNGYDHRISTGTYVIPAGSDYATIAKIITHSN